MWIKAGPNPSAAIEYSVRPGSGPAGDTITTDHISPAGAIPENSPAGRYLAANGVSRQDFNSYGSRRGNHEVMMRGTFGNIRLKNRLAPGTEGGLTTICPPAK